TGVRIDNRRIGREVGGTAIAQPLDGAKNTIDPAIDRFIGQKLRPCMNSDLWGAGCSHGSTLLTLLLRDAECLFPGQYHSRIAAIILLGSSYQNVSRKPAIGANRLALRR